MTFPSNDHSRNVALVKALMALREMDMHQVSAHTGVQIENFQAWLDGASTVLSQKSYQALLNYLGLTVEGFNLNFVQNWMLRAPSAFSADQRDALVQVSPLMGMAHMIEIKGSWLPMFSKQRLFAIRGDGFKVLVAVKGSWRMPPALTPAMFPDVMPQAQVNEVHVDELTWHSVRHQTLTPSEFDELFDPSSVNCSWNDVRLMARERGITPAMLARDILARETSGDPVIAPAAAKIETEQARTAEPVAIAIPAAQQKTQEAAQVAQAASATSARADVQAPPRRTRRARVDPAPQAPAAPSTPSVTNQPAPAVPDANPMTMAFPTTTFPSTPQPVVTPSVFEIQAPVGIQEAASAPRTMPMA